MADKKFQDVLVERNSLLHTRAIYEELITHLSKFLDTDSAPAKIGIKSDGEGMVVPQDLIMVVQNQLSDWLAEYNKAIEAINVSKVAENEQAAEKPKEAAASRSPQGKGSKRN